MTGKELLERMLVLGGRTDWQDSQQASAAISAANQAIGEVNVLFPLTKTVRLLHYPLRPVVYHKGIVVHRGGEDMEFDASGVKSLAFAVSGTGKVQLYVNGIEMTNIYANNGLIGEDREPLSTEDGWQDKIDFFIYKWIGAERADVKLVFSGEYSYMIKDLSFYDDVAGDMPEDVAPFGTWTEYDLDGVKYANGGFASLAASPLMIDGDDPRELREYKVEGSLIYLPSNVCGEVEVKYRARPMPLTRDNSTAEVDIDAELHALIPLKAAYYVYCLDDPEAAERCLAEYNRQMPLVVARLRKVKTPRKLKNVWGGW